MSYNPPPPQQYGGYPQQPQYGGQQPYPPQGYPPPQHGASPAPGQYGSPPPPGQYGAPPSGQYGTPPPQGQYGTPPPPGQYGAGPPPAQYGTPPPPGQYGSPPPGQYGAPPPGQYNGPPQQPYGAPPQQQQQQQQQQPPWGQQPPPPHYSSPPPQQPPSHTPQPQSSITFRFSEPGKSIVNSNVVDPWGRTGWTVSSPSKKETYIKNQGGSVVGRIEWHSSPKLEFLGYHGKTKEFIPMGRDKHTRRMRYDKRDYDLVEVNGVVNFHPRIDPSSSYAILRDPNGRTEIEIMPPGLALGNDFIEHVILVAVLYQSGHGFGDSSSSVNPGVWAAGAAAGVAVSC